MVKFFLLLCCTAVLITNSQQADAQILHPVKWEFSADKTGDNAYVIIMKATIDDGWKVYSMDIPQADNRPVPTSVQFDKLPDGVTLDGPIQELGHTEEVEEPLFDNLKIKFYHKRLTLRQNVRITKDATIKGTLTFMTCNDSQCLPPDDVAFSIPLKADNQQYISSPGNGNALNPVHWDISSEKISDSLYYINFRAQIESGWKVYSQHIASGGPNAAEFHFNKSGNYVLLGNVEEIGDLQKHKEPLFDNMVLLYFKDDVTFRQKIRVLSDTAIIRGSYAFQTCNDSECMPEQTNSFAIDIVSNTNIEVNDTTGTHIKHGDITAEFRIDNQPYNNCGAENSTVSDTQSRNLWVNFLLGLAGGLIGLLMPCTFPMIPFTISFFTKRSSNKRGVIFEAAFYGFSIVLVYFIASLPFLLFGASGDALNDFATNRIVNIIFFAVFIFFAISLFGVFEIRLPSAWANRADHASNIGGLAGIFFMALTLCIVSFSCTGPILGSLLANSLKGGGPALSAGMIGFGATFAIAFTLLALFPQLLKKLPKSGGWLNEIKVVFAFAELAFAFKFLSNVDLAYHWGFLRREIFLGIWTLLALLTFLYLVGFIRFSHDTKKVTFTIPRISFSLLFLACTLYFGQGLRKGSDVPLLSGFLPPAWYSLYHYDTQCPLGLNCFHDFDEAVAYAREVDKPIMVDFTGWACVNCRKMEEHVWPDKAVYDKISNDYVLVSLYVDDKKDLPDTLQYFSSTLNKTVKTIGNKWNDLQATYFNTVSQPYYVLLSPEGKLLNPPVAYTPDASDYAEFLQCGLDAFHAMDGVASK